MFWAGLTLNIIRNHTVSARAASSAFIVGATLLILAFPAGCVVFVQVLRSQAFDPLPAMIDALVMTTTMASFGLLLLCKWYFRRHSANPQVTPPPDVTSHYISTCQPRKQLLGSTMPMSKIRKCLLIGGITWVVLLVSFMIVRPLVRREFQRIRCFSQLCNLQLACFMYAEDHGGRLPNLWKDITLYTGNDCAVLYTCSARGDHGINMSNLDERSAFRLIPGRMKSDPANTVLAFEPLVNHSGRGGNVLFVGALRWCTPEEYRQQNIENLEPH